jgi:SSS family solute:Na+ symporter
MYSGMIVGVFAVFLILAILERTGKLQDHEGTPNSVGYWKLLSTLLATAVGGGLIFGLIGFGQAYGAIGILLGVVYCISFFALGLLSKQIRAFAEHMKSEGILGHGENSSIPLILAKKYNKVTWGIISSVYGIIYIGFLAAQYIAITKIVGAMGIEINQNILILASGLLVLVYVSIGGFGAVLRTDIFQLIIIGVILAMGAVLFFVEGYPSVNKLPNTYWDPFASDKVVSYFVWLAVFVFPSLLLRLDHWQRIVTAESDTTARNAYISSGMLLLVVFLLLLLVGAYATIGGSTDPFWLYKKNLLIDGSFWLPLLYGLAFTAFLAAIISSADTILNSICAFLSQTIKAWGFIKTDTSTPAILINIIITSLALVLALAVQDVVPLIVEGFKAVTILLPAVIAALFFKKPNSLAASISAGGGIVTYLTIKVLWEDVSNWAYVISFFVALISIILIYKFESVLKEVRPTN